MTARGFFKYSGTEMTFSRDTRHYQMAPRSLQTSKFGPYSRLTVEQPKYSPKAWAWAIGYGIATGISLWLVVAIRVGGGA
jgi:hypothetical protein